MSTVLDKANEILAERQEKIIPSNLPSNVNAFGVQGNVQNIQANYTSSNINKETIYFADWGNGYRTLECRFTSDTLHRNNSAITIPITNPNMTNNIPAQMGIIPSKIKKDENILGVVGTYEGSGGGGSSIPDYVTIDNILTVSNKLSTLDAKEYLGDWPGLKFKLLYITRFSSGYTELAIDIINVSNTEMAQQDANFSVVLMGADSSVIETFFPGGGEMGTIPNVGYNSGPIVYRGNISLLADFQSLDDYGMGEISN